MALPAPSSAYTGFFIKIGTTEANAKITEVALKLSADTEAVLKARFYLDKLIPAAQKQANGSIVYGFIGACIVGSDNYYMHNLNRIGAFRPPMLGADYISYADAGLNTLAKVTAQSVLTPEIDNFIVRGQFRTAYYVQNRNIGARYRISYNGDGTYGQWYEDAEVNEAGRPLWSLFTTDFILPSVIFTRVGFETRIQLQVYIINGEGRNTFPSTITSPVQLRPIKLRSQIGGPVTTYYTNYPDLIKADDTTSSALVTKLYRSSTGLPNSYTEQSGIFYHETNNNISYVFGTATVGGVTLTNYLLEIIDSSTPSLTFTPVVFAGFGATSSQACQKASIPDEAVIYVRYDSANPNHPDNGKYYNNGIGSQFAANGYYIDFDGLNYRIMQLTNGVMVDTGNTCSI